MRLFVRNWLRDQLSLALHLARQIDRLGDVPKVYRPSCHNYDLQFSGMRHITYPDESSVMTQRSLRNIFACSAANKLGRQWGGVELL